MGICINDISFINRSVWCKKTFYHRNHQIRNARLHSDLIASFYSLNVTKLFYTNINNYKWTDYGLGLLKPLIQERAILQ